ncbi:uncharacterized protein LOC129947256 [Eupeodes corollae]|uniref:uncharacterized protein LOC129947256 n=1 Tax=Eupeodes corollae TaxID=290404 RepID=UPI002490CC74|nr:uncharacterized protein LOC129947256 [Eupeodes corollae]
MIGNRFKGLSPDTPLHSPPLKSPPTKRPKHLTNFEQFPELPAPTNFKNPKFIVISSSDENKPLSNVSVFFLKKAIDAISKEYESITQLRDGNILILAKNKKVAEKFLVLTNLANQCPISVKYHDRLNSSKGIVFAPFLINVPENEIVSEMSTQGVIEVFKFMKNIEGKQRPTGLMLFTFDLYQAPTSVEIGFYKENVKEYIPNPMRCRKCQILGHTIKRCTKVEMCATCNLQVHENAPVSCTRVMCANCPPNAEPHPSSSTKCPKYIKNKDILTIKTRKKCSMAEARRLYYHNNPTETNLNKIPYNEKAITGNNTSKDNAISYEKPKHTTAQNSLSIPQTFSASNTITSSSSLAKTLDPNPKSIPANIQTKLPANKQISHNLKQPLTTEPTTQDKHNKANITPNSIKNPPKPINKPENMNVSDSETDDVTIHSPITTLTQTLLEQNTYFLPHTSNDNNHEYVPK